MGCGGSKLQAVEPANFKGATESMIQGMTKGEIKDAQCPHNARIEAALAAAKAEIDASKGKSVWDDHEADTELIGRGAFARVFKAIRRCDHQPVAIKVIGRDTKAFNQQRRALVTKIATMRTLQGHPNMLQLHSVFEDEEGFHVVVEYCKGAALLDQIQDRGHFSEREAAGVMRQLLEFLAYAHDDCNVVHRDIKPENLLLLDVDAPQSQLLRASNGGSGPDSGGVGDMLLKVIDFGTAGFCEPGQHLHSKVGTARYVAPEVLNQDYDRMSDIWSAGVVMYILLCGHPPFKGSTETGTLRQVKAGRYKLDDDIWCAVHDSAKDMLTHMLVVDPAQRWTAKQLLQHPWFTEVLSAPDRSLAQQPGYLERLGAFAASSRVKRLAIKVMGAAAASTPGVINGAELSRLRALFQDMDLDGDGIISGQQLHAGLASLGARLSEQDLAEFIAVSKVDCHSEGIDFNEFIAAMIDSQDLADQQANLFTMIEREFDELDVDHDGFITPQDLVAASRAGVTSTHTGRTPSPAATRPINQMAGAMGAAHGAVSAAVHDAVAEMLGGDLTLQEATAMLDEVDDKRTGKISLQEFTELVIGKRRTDLEAIDVAAATAGATTGPSAVVLGAQFQHTAAANTDTGAKPLSGSQRVRPDDTAHAELKGL